MRETRDRRAGPRPTDAAIVGMGAFFPGAPDLAPTGATSSPAGRHHRVPPGRWDPEIFYDPAGRRPARRTASTAAGAVSSTTGRVRPDPVRHHAAAVEGAEPDQLLALRVAAEAIADAGGEERLPADRKRVGVVLGRGGYHAGIARLDQRVRTADQLVATLRELRPRTSATTGSAEVRRGLPGAARPRAAGGRHRPGAQPGRLPHRQPARPARPRVHGGRRLRLLAGGGRSGGRASCAAGRSDVVLAGGVHHCHDITLWSVFTQLGALSRSQRSGRSTAAPTAVLIGEGTGVVVLKRLDDAERDGDRVYAVVRGTGVASDGRAASLMAPRPAARCWRCERAWRAAGLDPARPDALGLLEAHGTATPAGDAAELDHRSPRCSGRAGAAQRRSASAR